jgi:hypothetical protein
VDAGIRTLHGLEPERLTPRVLLLHPGWAASSHGDDIVSLPHGLQLDLEAVGVNGRDVAGAPVNGSQWFVYLCRDAAGEACGVLSQSIIYGGVKVPAGLTLMRKLPFGFVFNVGWGGIPTFAVQTWPKGEIRLTDAEHTALWMPLIKGTSAAFASVDLSGWIPDNARSAYLLARVEDAGIGKVGSAYLRSYGAQVTGVLVGSTTPSAPYATMTLWLRTTSVRHIEYRVTGGSRLTLVVLGYGQTEPS